MSDERTPTPWICGPYADQIASLFLRGRDAEAERLIKTANAEAHLTGCKPKPKGEVVYLHGPQFRHGAPTEGQGAA